MAAALSVLRMAKGILGWDLEELETLAQEDVNRSSDSDDESEDEVERMLPAQI